MDNLIEFLTNKIGYTLCAILFLGFPGFVFIFVWNRELFISMDIFRLVIFSFAIASMLYVPHFMLYNFIVMLEEKVRGKKYELIETILLPAFLTLSIMASGMIYKLEKETFTVLEFIVYDGMVLFGAFIVKVILEGLYYIRHRKNRKS